jgi:hypothetical protein
MQGAEGDLVVSHIVGRCGSTPEGCYGIPATKNEIETDGIAIHRVRDGKISSTGRSSTSPGSCSGWCAARPTGLTRPARGRG